MARRVKLRELAAADLEGASEYYRREADTQTALDFIDAVESAVKRIRRSPNIGSLRFAYELAIPDLRAWQLQRFPHVVFSVVTDEEIDIWRILHTRRDAPTLEWPEQVAEGVISRPARSTRPVAGGGSRPKPRRPVADIVSEQRG